MVLDKLKQWVGAFVQNQLQEGLAREALQDSVDDTADSLNVPTGHYCITGADRDISSLKTIGLGPCNAVSLYAPSNKALLVAHFNPGLDVSRSVMELRNSFGKFREPGPVEIGLYFGEYDLFSSLINAYLKELFGLKDVKKYKVESGEVEVGGAILVDSGDGVPKKLENIIPAKAKTRTKEEELADLVAVANSFNGTITPYYYEGTLLVPWKKVPLADISPLH